MIAPCHTVDCANAGVPIDVGDLTWIDDETGDERTSTVACGVCGAVIDDVADADADAGLDKLYAHDDATGDDDDGDEI